jgi:hypothetical protein
MVMRAGIAVSHPGEDSAVSGVVGHSAPSAPAHVPAPPISADRRGELSLRESGSAKRWRFRRTMADYLQGPVLRSARLLGPGPRVVAGIGGESAEHFGQPSVVGVLG